MKENKLFWVSGALFLALLIGLCASLLSLYNHMQAIEDWQAALTYERKLRGFEEIPVYLTNFLKAIEHKDTELFLEAIAPELTLRFTMMGWVPGTPLLEDLDYSYWNFNVVAKIDATDYEGYPIEVWFVSFEDESGTNALIVYGRDSLVFAFSFL